MSTNQQPPDESPWTFALAADGDLIVNDANTFTRIDGSEAIEQDLKVALQTLQGEDHRDPDFGLALFQAVRSDQALERHIRRTVEYDDYRHSRVRAVEEVTIDRDAPGVRHGVEVTVRVRLTSGAATDLQFEVGR